MTEYPFKVGSADFSDMVYKRGYKTVQTPVYGSQVTTMDGVTHRVLLRRRWQLTVYLNAPTAARAAALCAALDASREITYRRFQTGQDATETMELDGVSLAVLAKAADGTQWLEGVELTFTGM